MEDLSPCSSRLHQPRWSISGSTMVEPWAPALPKGWNSQYTSGATTPVSSTPIRISGEGISLRINGNLIEVSPTSPSNDADIESREQAQRPSWRSVSAWRRWSKANRTSIMTLFYFVYTLVLLVPAIVTPTLVWGIIRYKVLDGQLAPGLSDAVIAVLSTATCVFNTLLVLAMKGLGLIAAPWAQNLLTGIGVIATLVALRNSIQLPLQA